MVNRNPLRPVLFPKNLKRSQNKERGQAGMRSKAESSLNDLSLDVQPRGQAPAPWASTSISSHRGVTVPSLGGTSSLRGLESPKPLATGLPLECWS